MKPIPVIYNHVRGGYYGWHILGDVLPIINGDCVFETMDGEKHHVYGSWDLIIAHPPCTYLSNVATRHHSIRCTPLDKINARSEKRVDAMKFFLTIANSKCNRIAIENPVGVMSTCYRKADQIIEPWYFAEAEEDSENYVTKRTCLWLKGLPPLIYDISQLKKPDNVELFGKHPSGKNRTWEDSANRDSVKRSKTFPGIARAMAEQWG